MTRKKKPKTISKKRGPARKLTKILHHRASGFQHMVADNTLVRSEATTLTMTFYVRDFMVSSQNVDQIDNADGTSTITTKGLEEELINMEICAVRMSPENALNLAQLIVQQVSSVRSDLVEIKDGRVTILGAKE